jgi:hypothetical protein
VDIYPAASHALLGGICGTKNLGGCGTTVWIGTAWCAAVSTRVIQSCRMARVSGMMQMQLWCVSVMANCREENRLLAPYREDAELLRVPRSFW